jgi:hypothetical protein
VGVGLVYLLVVILFALLAVIGAFVALAVTGHALDLSALIGLLMLRGIVVTNAIVLLDLMLHEIEAGAHVRTALIQGGRTRVRRILMTAAATILALVPLARRHHRRVMHATKRRGGRSGPAGPTPPDSGAPPAQTRMPSSRSWRPSVRSLHAPRDVSMR